MTLEDEKRLALLAAILQVGGSGTKAIVLDAVEQLGLRRLSENDRRVMDNRNEVKWRNDLAFIRKHLVQSGFVSDERTNDWAITEKGRAYATSLVQRAASQTGTYVNLEAANSVITKALGPQVADEAAVSKETVTEEGAIRVAWTVRYERDPELRNAAIRIHGVICMACGVSFAVAYGSIGSGFIEVHHLRPISTLGGAVAVRPETDLVVLCSNCHSIVHRRRSKPLSMEELRAILNRNELSGLLAPGA